MGGVGSFMRQNRTLYIGRIHVSDDIEEIVARHFQEWGQIERVRVLTARGVAFVTYSNEVCFLSSDLVAYEGSVLTSCH